MVDAKHHSEEKGEKAAIAVKSWGALSYFLKVGEGLRQTSDILRLQNLSVTLGAFSEV
jgi:hypothetical protein